VRRARTVAGLALVVLLLAGVTACRQPVPSGPVTSENDAVARVATLPDVVTWIKLVQTESPSNRAIVEVNSEDATTYTVHAYELVQDELGGHSATFGWYEVTKATGIVRSVMP
jgi:hypothetical protein